MMNINNILQKIQININNNLKPFLYNSDILDKMEKKYMSSDK